MTPPLVVYPKKSDLEELLRTGATKTEPLARAAWKAERTAMPWPITETAQLSVNGRIHEAVHLNFLGEFKGSGLSSAPAPASYSPADLQGIRSSAKMLDLVFVLDVTNSMTPYIEAAKETVRDISRRLKDLEFQPDVALGLVAFRDHDPASGFVTRHFDLESNYDRFLQRISSLEARAGGDTPEAVYDGVYDALVKTSWRGRGLSARAIVLIGDASAHEPGDPQNPRNISCGQLVELARQRHVKVFALAPSDKASHPDRQRMRQQFGDLAGRAGCGNWYDITLLTAQGFGRRFAGRMETRKNSVSDPAMARPADD